MDNGLWKDGEKSLVGRGSGTEYTFHLWARHCPGTGPVRTAPPRPRAAGTSPRGQSACHVHMHWGKAVVEC